MGPGWAEKSEIFVKKLSNLYRKCFKNGFLLHWQIVTLFIHLAKLQQNRVKDTADDSLPWLQRLFARQKGRASVTLVANPT
jgi:hypothetical protein